MSWNVFHDDLIQVLERALTWQSRRHEIIAGNVANLDTPRYTRKDLNFQELLKAHLPNGPGVSLQGTNPAHLSGALGISAPGLIEDTGRAVDIDKEMIEMAANQLAYQTAATMLGKKLESLRAVIEGDRR